MKAHNAVLLLVILFLGISGCATHYHDPISKDQVKVVAIDSHSAFVTVGAYRENGQIVLEGKVKRRATARLVTGHVDIEIVDAKGKVVMAQTASIRPPRLYASGPSTAWFSLQLDDSVPMGSTVRVRQHAGTH